MGITRRERSQGLVEILLSGVAFGFLGLFGKTLYAAHVTPFELLAVRFTLAGVAMALVIFAVRRDKLTLTRGEIVACLGLGGLGYAVFGSFFFLALTGLPASLTVLLLYTYPVMVSVGGAVFFRERLSRGDWLAMGSVMVGLYWIVGPEWQVRDPRMIGFGVGAAVVYSGYILVSRAFLRRADPFQSACFIQLSAAAVLIAIAIRSPGKMLGLVNQNLGAFAGVSILCTVVAMSLFLSGLRKVSSTEVALFSTAEPVTGVIVAVLILNEKMSPLQWMGGLLILVALIAVALSHPRGKSRRPAPTSRSVDNL